MVILENMQDSVPLSAIASNQSSTNLLSEGFCKYTLLMILKGLKNLHENNNFSNNLNTRKILCFAETGSVKIICSATAFLPAHYKEY